MLRINPAGTVSPSAPLHNNLPTGSSASIATCGCRRLQLKRYLADLAGELEGTKCGHVTAFPSPTRISAPSSAEKDIGLCPVISAGADCCAASSPTASQVIVTPKNGCGSFLNLANPFVHVNRHNHARSTHSTHTRHGIFSWIRPRM